VNAAKTDWVVGHIRAAALEIATGDRPPRVACMGLAYKADIDDLRESPALAIARALVGAGMDVVACEPNIASHPEISLVDAQQAIEEADVVALLVAHREFKGMDFGDRRVLDFCGVLPSPVLPPRQTVKRDATPA
jgi:UDP-N-acetyl-D-mannosaminuronic acid dehydrogenase